MRIVKTLAKLPKRTPESHKGDFGRVLVIAGSVGMTGAACLAAESALRAGAGLVTLAIPQSLNFIVETKLTSVITFPVPETHEWTFSPHARDVLLELAETADVVALGPGISRNEETGQLVQTLIQTLQRPLVLDADALNAIAPHPQILRGAKAPVTITPHPGEMARLLGLPSAAEVQGNRREIAIQFAQTYQVSVVLKGYRTVVTDGTVVYENPSGNPGMASAGVGDVLTGMIAGLLPQFPVAFDAAQLAVFLHGLAGDLASRDLSQFAMTAEDVRDHLGAAFKLFHHRSRRVRGARVKVEETRRLAHKRRHAAETQVDLEAAEASEADEETLQPFEDEEGEAGGESES
jgi:NAD(P)H-hydrate epimerase